MKESENCSSSFTLAATRAAHFRLRRILLLLSALFLLLFPGIVSAQSLFLKSYDDNGYGIQYFEGGQGPAVLLVHGLGVTRQSFFRLAEEMVTKGFRVLLPDIPGQGETERNDRRNYSIESQADFLKRFLDSCRVKRALVVGNSMGGQIAASLALRYPVRVDRLVLISPAGLQAGGPPPYMVISIPQDADEKKKTDLEWNNHVREDIRAGSHYIMDPLLPRLQIPTLILWGEQDEILPSSLAEEWKRKLPKSRLVMLEELGHMAQDEDPDLVFSEIRKFVRH